MRAVHVSIDYNVADIDLDIYMYLDIVYSETYLITYNTLDFTSYMVQYIGL